MSKLIAINRAVKQYLNELICSSCSVCRLFFMDDTMLGHIKIINQFMRIHLTDTFCTDSRMGVGGITTYGVSMLLILLDCFVVTVFLYENILKYIMKICTSGLDLSLQA